MKINYILVIGLLMPLGACKQKEQKVKEPFFVHLSPLMEFYCGLGSGNHINDVVFFDTLFRLNDTAYIVNIDCREGCQSVGYCNVVVVASGEQVRGINYIKGYIDSVFQSGSNVYMYMAEWNEPYRNIYRLVLSDRFRFDSLIEERLVSNNVQIKVNPLPIDTVAINNGIMWLGR